MASGVGSSPFNGGSIDIRNESEVEALRRRHNRRMDRGAMRGKYGGRVSYDENGYAISSGYWRKPKRPGLKTLTDRLGNKYQTPDVIDWDDWLDIFKAEEVGQLSEPYSNTLKEADVRSLADLCHWSFDRPTSGYDSVECREGHITRIDYHNKTKVMRVHFKNRGDVVCYFFVPVQVYQTLKTLGEGMQTRIGFGNVLRHLVGIYFWDLVRVRGTQHGNRYECCYVTDDGGGFVKAEGASEEELQQIQKETDARKRGVAARMRKDGRGDAADILEGK